jgi:hypothetical protein
MQMKIQKSANESSQQTDLEFPPNVWLLIGDGAKRFIIEIYANEMRLLGTRR